jgi:hypothetical protein
LAPVAKERCGQLDLLPVVELREPLEHLLVRSMYCFPASSHSSRVTSRGSASTSSLRVSCSSATASSYLREVAPRLAASRSCRRANQGSPRKTDRHRLSGDP